MTHIFVNPLISEKQKRHAINLALSYFPDCIIEEKLSDLVDIRIMSQANIFYHASKDRLSITPLCLEHIIKHNLQITDLPDDWKIFRNLFLYSKKLLIQNLSAEATKKLKMEIKCMGGQIITEEDDITPDYIITNDNSPSNLKMISPKWINALLWEVKYIDPKHYRNSNKSNIIDLKRSSYEYSKPALPSQNKKLKHTIRKKSLETPVKMINSIKADNPGFVVRQIENTPNILSFLSSQDIFDKFSDKYDVEDNHHSPKSKSPIHYSQNSQSPLIKSPINQSPILHFSQSQTGQSSIKSGSSHHNSDDSLPIPKPVFEGNLLSERSSLEINESFTNDFDDQPIPIDTESQLFLTVPFHIPSSHSSEESTRNSQKQSTISNNNDIDQNNVTNEENNTSVEIDDEIDQNSPTNEKDNTFAKSEVNNEIDQKNKNTKPEIIIITNEEDDDDVQEVQPKIQSLGISPTKKTVIVVGSSSSSDDEEEFSKIVQQIEYEKQWGKPLSFDMKENHSQNEYTSPRITKYNSPVLTKNPDKHQPFQIDDYSYESLLNCTQRDPQPSQSQDPFTIGYEDNSQITIQQKDFTVDPLISLLTS